MFSLATWLRPWQAATGSSDLLSSSSGKKRLVPSYRDSWRLLTPFLAWAIAVVAVYSTAYASLRGTAAPISQLNVGNVVVYGSTRVIYYSLLTCSATSDAAKLAAQQKLAEEVGCLLSRGCRPQTWRAASIVAVVLYRCIARRQARFLAAAPDLPA